MIRFCAPRPQPVKGWGMSARTRLSHLRSSGGEGMTNRQPPRYLLVTPYARNVPVPACLWGDKCRLSDGKSARDARALLVVFYGERPMDVLVICAVTCHGSQHN